MRAWWPSVRSGAVRLTTTEVARATNGEVFGRDTTVDGASIDSRTIEPGRLFVPVVAERDGHDFIAAAVGAGAAAYLTAGPIEAGTAVLVDDTTQALGRLGSLARTRLEGHVVGVTGSVGKTSLKDLLGAVAATTWPTHVARGSFNNELGVPITLLDAPDGTGFTVVEMGARGQGHVAQLCEVARPTVGVVTVVAGAHLEQFGSLDTVAAAKGELVEALAPEGWRCSTTTMPGWRPWQGGPGPPWSPSGGTAATSRPVHCRWAPTYEPPSGWSARGVPPPCAWGWRVSIR